MAWTLAISAALMIARDLEIAFGRRRGADADGLVGQVEIGRAAVGLAEDGHDLDAEVPAGPDDAQGDFTTVGNQDALKHNEDCWEGRKKGVRPRCRNGPEGASHNGA